MCGIAGYSLSPESSTSRTLAAQALLAGISERGADAVGYAFRGCDGQAQVTKLRGGASALLDEIHVPTSSQQVLLHTRDHTKGPPDVDANNHPIRHGTVVGVHNGVIANDDEVFARHGLRRHQEEMTVDSEAIFALMEAHRNEPRVLRRLHGTMAAAWLDEREPDKIYLAKGIGRPLWIGRTATELYFASTKRALAIVEAVLRVSLETREVREGRVLEVVAGRIGRTRRFRPHRRVRDEPVSPVHSPHEAVSCLVQLASLASP